MISFVYTAKLPYSAELLHAFVQLFALLAPNNNIFAQFTVCAEQ